MAPKQRNRENKRYPANWRARKRGNSFHIFFRVPPGARHLWDNRAEYLIGKGSTLHEAEAMAYRTWADRIAISETPHTMGKALDRYEAEVIPEKSPATRKSNLYSIRRLRSVIPTDMPVTAFETHHAYEYRSQCARAESPKKANLDIELLSHVFTKCLEWGTPGFREHPIIKKITKLKLRSRDRYIEDWELAEFLTVASPMLQVYVPLKYALGIDQGIMLRIRMADIKDDRLIVSKRRKVQDNDKAKGKEYLFFDENGESTGLADLIEPIKIWRKKHCKTLSPWLFPTTAGECYSKEDGTASGFQTAWQRSMRKALAKTELQKKFTEHDICAKTASDAETLEQAAKLRGHLDKATTHKTYRRKPETVVPLKK